MLIASCCVNLSTQHNDSGVWKNFKIHNLDKQCLSFLLIVLLTVHYYSYDNATVII